MNHRLLGPTDLVVSPLGLGTVQLGMPYGYDNAPPPSDGDVVRLIHRALDSGINYLDTAAAYGRGEELVGKACAGRSDRPIIATKLSITNPETDAPLRRPALRRAIEASLHRSLRRLSATAIDLMQIHSLTAAFATPELLSLLEEFRASGLVRHWGVTTYGEGAPLDALEHPQLFSTLQVPYSALDRRMEARVFPQALATGSGIVLRSVFLQGLLSDKLSTLPPHLTALRDLAAPMAQVAGEAGLGLGELALRFAAFSPSAHSTIFGTTSSVELDANIAAVNAGPLPTDLIAAVRSIEVGDAALLDPSNWTRFSER